MVTCFLANLACCHSDPMHPWANIHTFAFISTQSGDLTVATWGGSTADNMESIEEDENDSGDGQEADDGN